MRLLHLALGLREYRMDLTPIVDPEMEIELVVALDGREIIRRRLEAGFDKEFGPLAHHIADVSGVGPIEAGAIDEAISAANEAALGMQWR
jgi:hypothetical protein